MFRQICVVYIGRLWAALQLFLITMRLITAGLITMGLITTGLITVELITARLITWAERHTLEKTGWCDIHQKISGCVTDIIEN